MNFQKGQKVIVRAGHNRKTFKWHRGTYLYKKDLYHYVRLTDTVGIIGVMDNNIKGETP